MVKKSTSNDVAANVESDSDVVMEEVIPRGDKRRRGRGRRARTASTRSSTTKTTRFVTWLFCVSFAL